MDNKEKYQIKTFLKFLIVSPWTEKAGIPNIRTIAWILIIISFIFRLRLVLLISLGVALIFYLWDAYKSGHYIYWDRNRRFRKQREALRKVREERKKTENKRFIKI